MIMPNENLLKAISWTLVHSVWQGLVLAIFAGLVIVFTKKSKATLRYNWLSGLFLAFMISVGFTFSYEYQQETAVSGGAIITAGALDSETLAVANTPNYFQAVVGYLNEYAATIVVVWFLIFAVKCFGIFRSLSNIYRIRNYRTQDAPDYWNRRVAELSEKLNIKKHIVLLESQLVKVPSVTGFFKPIILIPVGLLSNLPQDQIEAILLHELAHIRRKDYFINLLQSFAEILFFFNPGLLWISSLIKEERENCCDDIAVGITKSKSNFIHALVSFQEYNMKQNQLALGFGKNKNQLLERAKRIVQDNNKSLNTIEKTFLSICIIVIITFSFACSNTKATAAKTAEKENTEIAYLKNLTKDNLLTEEEIQQVKMEAQAAQKEAAIAKVEAEAFRIEAVAAADEAQKALKEGTISEEEVKQYHAEAIQAQLDAEKARKEHELARKENEKARREHEVARKEHEKARKESEIARKESEKARKESEKARKESEKARKEAEKARVEADKYRTTTGATFQPIRPMTFEQAQASGVCVMPNTNVAPLAKAEPIATGQNYVISRQDAMNSRIQANNERVERKIKASEKRIAAIQSKKDEMSNSKKEMWLVNQKAKLQLERAKMFEIKRATQEKYNLQKIKYNQDSLYRNYNREAKDKRTGNIVIPNDTDNLSRQIIQVLAKEKAIASTDNLSYKLSHDSIIVNGKAITGTVHNQLKKYLKPNISAVYYNYDVTAQDLAAKCKA